MKFELSIEVPQLARDYKTIIKMPGEDRPYIGEIFYFQLPNIKGEGFVKIHKIFRFSNRDVSLHAVGFLVDFHTGDPLDCGNMEMWNDLTGKLEKEAAIPSSIWSMKVY